MPKTGLLDPKFYHIFPENFVITYIEHYHYSIRNNSNYLYIKDDEDSSCSYFLDKELIEMDKTHVDKLDF
jgi:hypothetical protein